MSTNTVPANTTNHTNATGPSLASLIPFEQICEPGAYVCTWNGHLLRVPENGITGNNCPVVSFVGPEPLFVTKISNNPYITLSQARMSACNFDINVNF